MSRLIQTARSAYAAIEEPFPELISLHRTVKQLKEAVETMAGVRGQQGSLTDGISRLEQSLTTAIGTFTARIEEQNIVFVTDTEALAQQITLLEAQLTTGSDFVETIGWQFTNSDDGWTSTNITLAPQPDALRLTPTANDARFISPDFSIAGAPNPIIQYTIIRRGGNDWKGKLYYKTAGHGFSSSHYKQLPEPGSTLDIPQTFTVDMDALDAGGTDYNDSVITGIRFDFSETPADIFDVDSIRIGTTSAATLRAEFYQERTARVTQYEALAQQYTQLTATVNTNESDIEAKFVQEQTARSTLTDALAQQITQLTATVTTNNTATLAALTEEQVARADAVNAIAQQITTLSATVLTNENDIEAKLSQELTVRANAVSAVAQSVTNLSADVGDISAGFRTKVRTASNEAEGTVTYRWTASVTEGGTEYDVGMRAGINTNNTGFISFEADKFWLRDGGTRKRIFGYTNGKIRFLTDVVVHGDLIVQGSIPADRTGFNFATSNQRGGSASNADALGGVAHGTVNQRASNGNEARGFFTGAGQIDNPRIVNQAITHSKVFVGQLSQIRSVVGNPDAWLELTTRAESRIIALAIYRGDGTNLTSNTAAGNTALGALLKIDRYTGNSSTPTNVSFSRIPGKTISIDFAAQNFRFEVCGGSCVDNSGVLPNTRYVYRAYQTSGQSGPIHLILFELSA